MVDILNDAVEKYKINLIAIDCGAAVNAYTAAACSIAYRAFLIGEEGEISGKNFYKFPRDVRDYYSSFQVHKIKKILR